MFSLTYVSSAIRPYSSEELRVLASACSNNNQRNQITGILLYRDGSFMQVLEGIETSVRDLHKVIAVDPRHQGLVTILQRNISDRHFRDWAMRMEMIPDGGFHDCGSFVRSIESQSQAGNGDPTVALLRKFADAAVAVNEHFEHIE
jgi:hypothetical protein